MTTRVPLDSTDDRIHRRVLAEASNSTSQMLDHVVKGRGYLSQYNSLPVADLNVSAVNGILVINQDFTLTANTTLASKEVIFSGGKITLGAFNLTINGSVLAGDEQLFVATGAGVVSIAKGIVNVMWFGAVANGVADDTAPLKAAMACADTQAPGTGAGCVSIPIGILGVSSPIPFVASLSGANGDASTIKALAGFSGTYVLDFNPGTTGRYLNNFGIDLTALGTSGTVTAFGSSSAGGGGGGSIGASSGLTIRSASLATYAMHATSSTFESGMFTGRTWTGLQITAPAPLYIGNNQDECVFVNCRFKQQDGATVTPFVLAGTDIVMEAPYFGLGDVATSTLGIFQLARNTAIVDPFTEGTTNADWCFVLDNLLTSVRVEGLKTNLVYSGAAARAAMFHVTFSDVPAPPLGNGITLDSFYNINGTAIPYGRLFSLKSTTAAANYPFTFDIRGVGYELYNSVFGTFAIFDTGTTANANKIWQFAGQIGAISGAWNAPSAAAGNPIVFSPITQPATWP